MSNNARQAEMSLSPTLVFPLLDNNDHKFRVRTLLDPGSGTNWIVSDILSKVSYSKVGSEVLEVVTFSGNVKRKFQLVEVYYENEQQERLALRCYVIDEFTRHIAVKGMLSHIVANSPEKHELFDYMVDPASKDVDHTDNQGIGIILCSNSINKIRKSEGIVLIPTLNILLEPTIFGVAISGEIPSFLRAYVDVIQANHIVPRLVKQIIDPELCVFEDETTLRQDIDFIWGQDMLGIMPGEIHEDDRIAIEHFIGTIEYKEATNQYTVYLPWNKKKYLLRDNASVAAGRTRRQQDEMIRKKEYGEMMCKSFNDYYTGDYVEKVDLSIPNDNIKYYMPFRGVINKSSETTTCRMVMDASSKPSASDISLNQALYQGPNLTLELAICLLQFMLGIYGVVADIEKAFLRILIAECDRDALRFFWFEDPFDPNSKLVVYRFKAVIFGGVASPFQLAAVLQKLISDKCDSLYVKNALLQGTYVDNVMHANNSEDKMVEFFETSRSLLSKGNFNLRKWCSNSPRLMTKAKQVNVAEECKVVKVLGLFWNIDTDRYLYNTHFEWSGKFTKRSALQYTNKVFDPVGLLTPISMSRRLFLQKLWRLKLKWDESFEFHGDLAKEWLHLVKETHIAITCTFKRNAVLTKESEIHIFSDASMEAYGAVVYIRTPPSPQCPKGNVHLTFAKGKVAPLDGKQTVPKLETAGALVGAHQVPFITRALNLSKNHQFYLWCDAKCVLNWFAQFSIKDLYVHNRVKDIRKLYCKENTSVKYVPSAQNPADLITKPQKAVDFVNNSEWWNGPWWLLDKNNWPETEETYELYPEGVEEATTVCATSAINVGLTSIISFFSISTFEAGLRKMAYLLRWFKTRSRISASKEVKYDRDFVSKEELDDAKLAAIRVMQSDMFAEELHILNANKEVKKGPCRKWSLFLDSDGIIRCKGRLLNLLEPRIKNNPILVHGHHPFIESYIRYKHLHSNCSSRNYTLHKVRKEFHGPSLTVSVNKIVRQCNACRVLRAKPYSYPEMPPLPKERLAAEKPFAICGVDFSGPHFVKEGRRRQKVWIALFTCMVSRAVSLEAVPSLSADSFLQALQALAWKKGTPRILMSDNATNFCKTSKILFDIQNTKYVKETLAIKGVTWNFTPTRAPWFGAVYERLIGVMKREMVKLIGQSSVTYYELTCQLAEIEFVINSRPLIKVGQEEVVTPNNILFGREVEEDSILTVLETKEVMEEALKVCKNLPKISQNTIQRKNAFWQSFQRQYLESIKFSVDTSHSKGSGLTPKEGDLVIMHSHDPRIRWRKAIVIQPIASDDGSIRKCLVKTSTGQTIRAINHLFPLEINVEDCIDYVKEKKLAESNDFEGFSIDSDSPRIDKALKLKEILAKSRVDVDSE